MVEKKRSKEFKDNSLVKQDDHLGINEAEKEKLMAKHEAKNDMDKELVLALSGKKEKKIPSWEQLRRLGSFLSAKEALLIKFSLIAIGLLVVILFFNFWFFSLKLAPAYGGEYSEGVIGSPKFINSVLAYTNDVDLDISSLVYCGLLRRGSNGLENDLADSYTISSDQKEYTFKIKSGIKWHSGKELTVDDVLFTFDLIKDPEVNSPLARSFQGITAEKIDDYSFKFILQEPFIPFLSTLTFGILPEYLWGRMEPANIKLADSNLKPVGCGPYKFSSLIKEKNGNVKSLTLVSNNDYYRGRPYLDKIVFKFYPDADSLEQALINKNVMAAGYLSEQAREKIFGKSMSAKGLRLDLLNLPQYSAVFFNQNNSEALKEKQVRQALYQAINRQSIIDQVLPGAAGIINSPILPGFIGYNSEVKGYDYSPEKAADLLSSAKWKAVGPQDFITLQREQEKKDAVAQKVDFVDRSDEERLKDVTGLEYLRLKDGKVLEITLTVVDQPENLSVADIIKDSWQKIGVKVILNVVPADADYIRREVIKPRNYQALIYSEIIGYDPDPYPFWHSSQTNSSGLNLSLLNDKRVDRYLEDARKTTDEKVRADDYKGFQEILVSEVPAIFLYQPKYFYIINESVNGLNVDKIFIPADRLADMASRFLKTKRSW